MYICYEKSDYGNNALFYVPSIGRKRIYRNSFKRPEKGLKILKFKNIDNALKLCDHTNSVHNSNYKPKLIKLKK